MGLGRHDYHKSLYIIVLQAFDFTKTSYKQIKVELRKIWNLGRLNNQVVVATYIKKKKKLWRKKKKKKKLFSGCC